MGGKGGRTDKRGGCILPGSLGTGDAAGTRPEPGSGRRGRCGAARRAISPLHCCAPHLVCVTSCDPVPPPSASANGWEKGFQGFSQVGFYFSSLGAPQPHAAGCSGAASPRGTKGLPPTPPVPVDGKDLLAFLLLGANAAPQSLRGPAERTGLTRCRVTAAPRESPGVAQLRGLPWPAAAVPRVIPPVDHPPGRAQGWVPRGGGGGGDISVGQRVPLLPLRGRRTHPEPAVDNGWETWEGSGR